MPAINPIDLVFKELPAGVGAVNLVFGADTSTTTDGLTVDGALPVLGGEFNAVSVSLLSISGTLPALLGTFYAVDITRLYIDGALPALSGEFSAETVVVSLLSISEALPALSGEFHAVAVSLLNISGSLPALSGDFSAVYESNTSRPTVGQTQQPWQVANQEESGTQAVHTNSLRHPAGITASHQDADTLQLIAPLSWQNANQSVRESRSTGFQSGQHTPSHQRRSPWQDANHSARQSRTNSFQAGIKAHPTGTVIRHQDGYRDRRNRTAVRWQNSVRKSVPYTASSAKAVQLPVGWQTDFQEAMRPPAGKWVVPPIVVPPWNPCYTPDGNLLFDTPWDGSADLLFKCDAQIVTPPTPGTTVIVPIRKVYIVLNNVHLLRVDGNLELPALALSLSIDMDSWTWSFNASLPASALSWIEPGAAGDPVLLKAIVNGASYLLLAEGITRDRAFGQSTISVSGRGQSAALADPYSPIMTFANTGDRTAQQLMADALTTNGVSIGWAIDWRITDWLVPAGVWSHQGSYMSAVNTIAAAAGAFIQPDPMLKTLRVRPRYPYKPWEWYGVGVTPDIELPAAAIVKESIAWSEKPAYNAVYVSGATTGGILGHVKRTGSAGDVMAPMITDALITHADAARQRGLNVLADTGRIATYSLSLPVLPETGIIEPGALIRYVDNGQPIVGVVNGVSVNTGTPSVRQTIEVQTHG